MSTYYQFRCPVCEEQGGFYSRQRWGWGNCDIFENFKFTVAHTDCGSIEILSEHAANWADETEERRWLDRLAVDDDLREGVWPHADEWQFEWAEAKDWWRNDFVKRLARRTA